LVDALEENRPDEPLLETFKLIQETVASEAKILEETANVELGLLPQEVLGVLAFEVED